MSIEDELAQWDGRSADAIRAIYDRHSDSAGFETEVLAIARRPALQAGATWLLKRHIEQANTFPTGLAATLYRLADALQHWEARLHLLQCMPHVAVPASCKRDVYAFLLACIQDDKTFVRAWAYGGMYELARQYGEYREVADELLASAAASEKPAVRARIRKITGTRG